MAGKPARSGERAPPGVDEPSEEGTAPSRSAHTTPGQRTESSERVGPVGVARLRKADGRALLLYSAGGERA